jgi:acetyltransferase-like isoleucine patch superfamily enzyme
MQVNVGDPSADPWIIVGDGVIIGAGSQLSASAGIVLEAGVRLGEEVLILDNTHTYEDPSTPIPLQPVRVGGPIRIGPGVYVGRGAVILMGVTIGEDAVIADRSVVQHDVPPRAWVAGCPARAVPPPPREPAR